MKQFYFTGKVFWDSIKNAAISVAMLMVGSLAYSQSATPLSTIPESIFKNPTLYSGTAGQDGAVYRFPLVVAAGVLDAAPTGVDALLTINSRGTNSDLPSSGGLALKILTLPFQLNISDNGYENSWQPQLRMTLTVINKMQRLHWLTSTGGWNSR